MKEVPTPGREGTSIGINDLGQVIGNFSFNDAKAGIHGQGGFLYSGGKTIDLSTLPALVALDWEIEGVYAINNAEQILGFDYYNDQNGDSVPRYFLLSPIKEK